MALQRVFNRYCIPNSLAIPTDPTDPTQNPEWEDVKWTPLVKIPGMPTGDAPLGGYIVALYNFLLGAIGIIAMIMLVYGGFRYMTSAGNPTAMGDAKDIFYSAIIGLALALISYLIIGTINPELLFTQDAKLTPAGSPGYSTNLPACDSCAYKSHGGYEESKSTGQCRCIGDPDESQAPSDTDCEGPIENYSGTCDEFCENSICVSDPACCLHAELRASTDLEGIGKPNWGIITGTFETKVGKPVYFNARDYSYNCKKPGPEGIALYAMDNSNIANLGGIFPIPQFLQDVIGGPLDYDYVCVENTFLATPGLNPCTAIDITAPLIVFSNFLGPVTIYFI